MRFEYEYRRKAQSTSTKVHYQNATIYRSFFLERSLQKTG